MARRASPARRARSGSFPTTADVGLWARARDARGLFEALGEGLFSIMTDRRGVRAIERRELHLSADDPGALVVAFLNELLLLESSEGYLVRTVRARVAGRPPRELWAVLFGERADPSRHHRRVEVKAATYHALEVAFDPPRARVVLDI